MAFQKAQRKQAKLRLALCGPSGSGKTYSALLIAQGLASDGKIALIDTEHGSGELYAHLTDYDVSTLSPPYTPDRYIELIQEAEQAGFNVLIIDSLSHAWTGQGGVLDMHEKASTAARGNSWAAWREVTPQHNALVEAMLGANLHLIVTLRTKTAYEVTDDNGKKKPVKVGLAPVQRDGMEYEFTLLLDLTVDGHIATAAKDRTSLLDGQHFIPSPEIGERLREWLDTGVDPREESRKLLASLKARVDGIDNLSHLNNWWRKYSSEITSLVPADKEDLTAHCATRKEIIMTLPEEEKTERRPPRGNGKAKAAATQAE